MHKPFYASGFLYHSASQQILLQQFTNGDDVKLVFFREKGQEGHDPQRVFKSCVEKALGISLPASAVRPVYDYVHSQLGEQFIFYVEVAGTTPKTYASKNKTEWYMLSKLSKCNMSEQTRHDIVVGERVIRSLLVPAYTPQYPKRH